MPVISRQALLLRQTQRAAEVLALRAVTNALPVGTDFIVCGDF